MGSVLKKQLKTLKHMREQVNPSSDWKAQNRAQLYSQIGNTVNQETLQKTSAFDTLVHALHIFVPRSLQIVAKPALACIAVIGLATAGWGVGVRASSDSLPGEALWHVKIAFEKTEIAVADVTKNKKKEAVLQVKFAGRRAQEIKDVVVQQKPTDTQKSLNTAFKQLKTSIKSASTVLDEVKTISLKDSAEIAEVIDSTSEEILSNLEETKRAAKDISPAQQGVPTPIHGIVSEVDEATLVVEDTSIKSIGVIVETGLADENTDTALLKEKVVQKLAKVSTHIEAVEADVATAVSSTEAVMATFTSTTLAQTTSTIAVKEQFATTKERADQIVDKTKILLEQNALLDAVQGVQELTVLKGQLDEVAKQTQQTLVNTSAGVTNTTAVTTTNATTTTPIIKDSTSSAKVDENVQQSNMTSTTPN